MTREEQAAAVGHAADVLTKKLEEFLVVMENNNSYAWMKHGPCGQYVLDLENGDDMAILVSSVLGHRCP